MLIHIKRDATQVWYQLGDALGIKKAILDKFTTCSPEEAIIEMLDYWLRSHTGKPTWKEVADALRKIHLRESASGIETLSKTGKYHKQSSYAYLLFFLVSPDEKLLLMSIINL